MKLSLYLLTISMHLTSANYAYALQVKLGDWSEQVKEEVQTINKEDGDTVYKYHSNLPPILTCYTAESTNRIGAIKKGDIEKINDCTHIWTESSDTQLVRESTCESPGIKTQMITDITKISDTHYVSTMNIYDETPTTKTVSKQKTTSMFVSSTCSIESLLTELISKIKQ